MKCLECHKEVRSINYLHLKACSGITPHDYRKKHPNSDLMDPDVKASSAHYGKDNHAWRDPATKQTEWIRLCPSCGRERKYKSLYGFREAGKTNSTCKKCVDREWMVGRTMPEEIRKKISQANLGKEYNKSNLGKKFSESHRRKISEGNKGRVPGFIGKTHSEETKCKQRIKRVEDLISKFGSSFQPVNYSKKACALFNEINQKMGWNGVHAENGGEFHVHQLGYWLDYYEPNLKIAIEFDEKQHNIPSRERRDLIRQLAIVRELGCKFFRIKDGEETKWEKIVVV